MEIEIALGTLRKRLPVLKLGAETQEYNDNHNVRSLKGLKLVW